MSNSPTDTEDQLMGSTGNGEYLNGLTRQNLAQMREVIRRIHFEQTGFMPSDRECDRIIEAWGQMGCEAELEKAIFSGAMSSGQRYFFGKKHRRDGRVN